MAYFIKVNKRAWAVLKEQSNGGIVEGDRYTLSNGNVLLWQADGMILASYLGIDFQGDTRNLLISVCEQIGGVILDSYTARDEQDGKINTQLPEAKDERFIVKSIAEQEEESSSETEEEQTNEQEEES